MYKYIEITKGKKAIVDSEDYNWLVNWKWHFSANYACRATNIGRKHKTYYMHKEVLGCDSSEDVKHINGDRLDNRKQNLMIVSVQNKPGEKWGDIEGYEGLYMVSNYGRIKSLKRLAKNKHGVKNRVVREKIMSLSTGGKGEHWYQIVTLTKNGEKKSFTVHRLVGKSFVGGYFDGAVINHKDGCKSNNYYKNLEWVTHIENNEHALKSGLLNPPIGERCANSKLKKEDVINIRTIWNSKSLNQKEIADMYGITQSNVNKIIKRVSWAHV